MSLVRRAETFISTSFFCHADGSMADTVINPRGGTAAFLDTNFNNMAETPKGIWI